MASPTGDIETVTIMLKGSQHSGNKENYVPEKIDHMLKDKEEFVTFEDFSTA